MVNLADLLEWHRSEGNEIVERVEKYLEDRKVELEEIEETRAKETKKLKGPKLEEYLAENPHDPTDYEYPSKELLQEMLEKRLEHPSCNAGAVFDNMHSETLWKTTEDMMELILAATPNQKLQIVNFIQPKDEDNLPLSSIINPTS